MHMSTHATLQKSHQRLSLQLLTKRNELARRYSSQGKSHDVAKMNRLVEQILVIQGKLNSIERMLSQ